MDAISQRTFSNAFSGMKIFEFELKFHWRLFPRVQLTKFYQAIGEKLYHSFGHIQILIHILNWMVVIIQWGICLPDCSGYEGLQYNNFSYENLTSCVLGVTDSPQKTFLLRKLPPTDCNSQHPGSNTSQNVILTTIKVLRWVLGWW